jgi:hypothetical protein
MRLKASQERRMFEVSEWAGVWEVLLIKFPGVGY